MNLHTLLGDHYTVVVDTLGWTATAVFIASFLVKNRSMLHLLGFGACILKMVYTWEYHVMPLFVNWVLLFAIELYQYFQYKKKEKLVARVSDV